MEEYFTFHISPRNQFSCQEVGSNRIQLVPWKKKICLENLFHKIDTIKCRLSCVLSHELTALTFSRTLRYRGFLAAVVCTIFFIWEGDNSFPGSINTLFKWYHILVWIYISSYNTMYIIQMKYLEKTVILQDVMHIHIYIYSMNKSKEEILQGEVTI